MNIRKILARSILIVLFSSAVLILFELALESDFAKVNSKNAQCSAAGYKMKTKFYEELYYSTEFKRDLNNDNMLSLGNFIVNTNNQRKLIMKVTIETEEDTIDTIMDRQSVIRNDVIDSILNLKSSCINQDRASREIKKNLNQRLKADVVKNVYFEKFIIQ